LKRRFIDVLLFLSARAAMVACFDMFAGLPP
jgi:hypothetical protein